MVIPRSRSSGALSIESNARNCTFGLVFANTLVIAAVSVVLPWSMCPIVPMFTCGLLRSNFSFAIVCYPQCAHHTQSLERGTGFEPATIGLEGRDSTAELPPHAFRPNLEPGTGIEPVTSSLPR